MKPTTPTQKQCYGNFCTLSHPDCVNCAIDEALDEKTQITFESSVNQQAPERSVENA